MLFFLIIFLFGNYILEVSPYHYTYCFQGLSLYINLHDKACSKDMQVFRKIIFNTVRLCIFPFIPIPFINCKCFFIKLFRSSKTASYTVTYICLSYSPEETEQKTILTPYANILSFTLATRLSN